MNNHLQEIFNDEILKKKIKDKLPHLFHIAELESSRAGKIGMQVGSAREAILIALLIYKFGEENVDTQIPITEAEIDVKLFGNPISIKTITGKRFSGVKLVWTVDAQKAKEFRENYYPHCDILLVQINWNNNGGLYYIPMKAQERVFKEIGRENYIKLPKSGTNPRGVEITKQALSQLLKDKETHIIEISWQRSKVDYNPYRRWVDYWKG